MHMFFDDEHSIVYDRPPSVSIINKPPPSNEHKSEKKCSVCGKPEVSGGPAFITRYGGFICSSRCYDRFTFKSNRKVINQDDAKNVRELFIKRRAAKEKVDSYAAMLKLITTQMTEKNISLSCAPYYQRWFRLESFGDIGYPNFYKWNIMSVGAEVEPEYAKKYSLILDIKDYYEIDLISIDKFLTSGKCIRYDRG